MLKAKRSSFQDYAPHPEGRFNGIIYAWKFVGENNFGNERAMLRIESLDVTIEDENSDHNGQPYTVALFHNISFGNHKRRSGNWMPHMQKVRELILDRKLTDDEWYEFDAEKLMGVRVRYKVTHNPRKDGNGVWANPEIIEPLEDQTVGDLFNEIEVEYPPEESESTGTDGESDGEDLPLDTKRSGPSTTGSAPRPSPAPPKPKVDDNIAHPLQKEYAVTVIELLGEKGLFEKEGVDAWKEFLTKPDLKLDELQDEYKTLEEAAADAGITLPNAKIHPMSLAKDALPL
tara:strand:+ start:4002 stop:4865 length:864 start_codon:yes stop_codon:yes gene_type:complete